MAHQLGTVHQILKVLQKQLQTVKDRPWYYPDLVKLTYIHSLRNQIELHKWLGRQGNSCFWGYTRHDSSISWTLMNWWCHLLALCRADYEVNHLGTHIQIGFSANTFSIFILEQNKAVGSKWQFLSKPEARLLKDLQLVGLLCAISFAQSVLGSWTTQYIRLLYCSAVGQRQNTSPIKLELSENSTTCWSSGEVHHQSAFLSDSDIMRMLLTTISRRWCKKLPNWLSQCPS